MTVTLPVADICDRFPDRARVLGAQFRLFTAVTYFAGPCRLIALHASDEFLSSTLSSPGDGAVAVVGVGAHPGPAVFGDGMARAAQNNGWAGVVIDGALRDVALIRPRGIGIAATEVRPMIARDGPAGSEAQHMMIAGVRLRSGDWIVVDEDGAVALDGSLAGEIAD
ncbi:MAG: S-adenosylmethionine--2-demethylmenaquinone methyltransferase [Pseudomonadota bacterium]